MTVAKVFDNERSQAVRLPEDFRFEEAEVYIKKIGRIVVLFPKDTEWDIFTQGLADFSDDFMVGGRSQGKMSEREQL